MNTDKEYRETLRQWVMRRGRVSSAEALTDSAPLLENRWVTSLEIAELLMLIERLRGEAIDTRTLTPADLASIDAIVDRFLSRPRAEEPHGSH